MSTFVFIIIKIGVLLVFILAVNVVKACCFLTFLVIGLFAIAFTFVTLFSLIVMIIIANGFLVRFFVTPFVAVMI